MLIIGRRRRRRRTKIKQLEIQLVICFSQLRCSVRIVSFWIISVYFPSSVFSCRKNISVISHYFHTFHPKQLHIQYLSFFIHFLYFTFVSHFVSSLSYTFFFPLLMLSSFHAKTFSSLLSFAIRVNCTFVYHAISHILIHFSV